MPNGNNERLISRRRKLIFVGKILTSAAAVALIAVHWSDKSLSFDATTWGLFGICILPWISGALFEVVDTAKIAGWEFKFRDLKRRQEAQQTELEVLKFLVNYVVTDDELKHLRHFLSNEPWPFDKTATGTNRYFETELRRLRAMKWIVGQKDKGIRTLFTEGGDVKTHFKITKPGEDYLKIRDRINASSSEGA